ncbi:MAG: hypothetical protein QW423_01415 [Candidatus Aenigmatarchaeota archaeon]
MKAQISFVEFFTSMIIFIGFATYISFQIYLFFPNYLNEIKAERMRSEAFQLSELLINDPGEPANWYEDFDSAKRIGLSDETKNMTNFLSSIKISSFFSNCSVNYTKIKKKLDTDYNFIIILKDSEDKIYFCSPQIILPSAVNITMRRVIAFKDDNIKYGELLLQVW